MCTPARPDAEWTDYNAAQFGRPPRKLALAAMEVAGPGAGRTAVELGCGIGVEARALADRGWQVHSFDADESVAPYFESLRERRSVTHAVRRLEELRWLPANDLTLACVSLPFVDSRDVLSLLEDERDGMAFSGPKHWHTFEVIARRPRA